MRRLALALMLAGCSSTPQTCPKPVVTPQTKPESCPKPPRPDECVAKWYARADTPQCVDDWIDALAEHRNTKRKRR